MTFENRLYYGDNLAVLKELARLDPFVDLIYIDPPFNSKRNYNILFENLIQSQENGEKTTALKEAFCDSWSNVSLASELEEMKSYGNLTLYNFLHANRVIFSDAQMSYLTMMAHRLYYMYKILKDTGSFYLHCDPTMSHYLKLLLDIIFGRDNFRNEIVWCYTQGGRPKNDFAKKHDIIFRYTKSKNYCFNADDIKIPYELVSQKSEDSFTKQDPDGRRYKEIYGPDRKKKYRYYKDEGKTPYDWWTDIHQMTGRTSSSKQSDYLGYPTQKPLALLERIIKSGSRKGDVVADFFCGCGTTVTAAEQLGRKWIGVDINHLAIGLIEHKRLKPLGAAYRVLGFPSDQAQAEKLAKDKPFEFEHWIVEYVFKGHATKKTGDGGFDGHLALDDIGGNKKICLIEVKGGKCSVKNVRELSDVIRTQNADLGVFVCFERHLTTGMIRYCDTQGFLKDASLLAGMHRIPIVSPVTVENILADDLPDWLTRCLNNVTYL